MVLSFYIRFKYLNPYEHLTEPPLLKPDAKELHPDANTPFGYNPEYGFGYGNESRSNTFHHYLDEFLIAIRVFGFLEKPVFHELSRHLQTRRLIAGDTILLDSERDRSFYCVIDGTVQVYAKSRPGGGEFDGDGDGYDGEHDGDGERFGEDIKGYQLLNEVGRGGTLSSLFTILSLFTEDVDISWKGEAEDDEEGDFDIAGVDSGGQRSPYSEREYGNDAAVPTDKTGGDRDGIPDSDSTFTVHAATSPVGGRIRSHSHAGTPTNVKPDYPFITSPSTSSSVNSPGPSISERNFNLNLNLNLKPTRVGATLNETSNPSAGYNNNTTHPSSAPRPSARANKKERTRQAPHPHALRGLLARATEDTTLAVIPAEAFRRLTQKFPKASGHIVQGGFCFCYLFVGVEVEGYICVEGSAYMRAYMCCLSFTCLSDHPLLLPSTYLPLSPHTHTNAPSSNPNPLFPCNIQRSPPISRSDIRTPPS